MAHTSHRAWITPPQPTLRICQKDQKSKTSDLNGEHGGFSHPIIHAEATKADKAGIHSDAPVLSRNPEFGEESAVQKEVSAFLCLFIVNGHLLLFP